ncbi:fascin domain-containing protein [Actinoplanes sp. G11-F43]|uniref:fascin domain-containing protein n=1 Tax=Actinoplanes sp. G11-F43 TaxID=3424130 RepID=UPI003D32F7AF
MRIAAFLAINVSIAGLVVLPAPAAAVLTPPGSGSAALERMRGQVAAETGAADVPCWRNITIRSSANGRYVSAEIGWEGALHGALRARAATPGKWEKFIVCRDPDTGVTNLKAQANDNYVSAELDYAGARYGMLRAQAAKVEGWERYYSNSAPGGQFSFYARDTRRWVAAESTFTGVLYGVLRARATSVSAEETFAW